MSKPHLSDEIVRDALAECAAEPVHIPGTVQPFGCLVGMDAETREIHYASENCGEIIGYAASALFGKTLRETLGSDVEHALNNAAAFPLFETTSIPLGMVTINAVEIEAHAFRTGAFVVLELEPHTPTELGDHHALNALSLLIDVIEGCDTQKDLFDSTVDCLRQFSGYDRVMVYRFDREFNGEIIAEDKRFSMEPLLGLRFPSFDIPAQAREIMSKVPLRFIQDIAQTPVPIRTRTKDTGPLDITMAYTRGVSPVHMQYLQNMGVQATMTLSLVVDGKLWGMISFHHQRPRVPPAMLRRIFVQVLSVFTTKLEALRQREVLDRIDEVEQMKDDIFDEIDANHQMQQFFHSIGQMVSKVMRADGASVLIGSQRFGYGEMPGQSITDELLKRAQAAQNRVVAIESIEDTLPDLVGDANETRGALVYATDADRAICFFRRGISTKISWAGDPEKTIEVAEGRARLSPRGSFKAYLEDASSSCEQWTEQDILFARQIWNIVNAAERRVLLNTINRQQQIMIDELNHRVRNILALVRSVSRQARRRYGTLNSYAKSLESRIQALANVHDIYGTTATSMGLHKLIMTEFVPYQVEGNKQIELTGDNPRIRADVAPIFSLIMHELTTNAAKYGALTVETGKVLIDICETQAGYVLTWQEVGGPPVSSPQEFGFGTTLIEQAVPHEMDGSTTLTFKPGGVEAEIVLPHSLFDWSMSIAEVEQAENTVSISEQVGLPSAALNGTALVLEDNFVIAKEMGDQLSDFGFRDVVSFSNVPSAMEFIDQEVPLVALLDVNLGNGVTSAEVALRLHQLGVATVFSTGYGEKANLPSELNYVPRLTKPVDPRTLKNALAVQISKSQK